MKSNLLDQRVARQLVLFALGASALGSLLLAAVSGALVLRVSLREVAQEAAGAERGLAAGLTSFQPIYSVQSDLQNAVSSQDFLAGYVIDGRYRVLAASDTAVIGRDVRSLTAQSDLDYFLPLLDGCLKVNHGWGCLKANSQTILQGPLPWVGGSRLIQLSLVPLALQGMQASDDKALLVVVVDLAPTLAKAGALMAQVFLLGLLPLFLTSTAMVIVIRRALLPELFKLAQADPLSGVLNRRAFLEAATHRLQANRSSDGPRCFALLDIDYFKGINDRYGHEAGDHAICFVSHYLQSSLRKTDLVSRFGGDEFALLIHADPENAYQLLDRLRESLAEMPISLADGRSFVVTLSIGMVAAGSKQRWDLQELFQAADAALYVAKDQGRNQVVDLDRAGSNWRVSSR